MQKIFYAFMIGLIPMAQAREHIDRCRTVQRTRTVDIPEDVTQKQNLHAAAQEAERVRVFHQQQYDLTLKDYQGDEAKMNSAEAALLAARATYAPRLATLGDLQRRTHRTREQRAQYLEQKAVTSQLLDSEDPYLRNDLGDYLLATDLTMTTLPPPECPAFANTTKACELVQATLAMLGQELAEWKERHVDFRELNAATPVLKVLRGLQSRQVSLLETALVDLEEMIDQKTQALVALDQHRAELKDLEDQLGALEADRDTLRVYFNRSAQVLVRLEKNLAEQRTRVAQAQTQYDQFRVGTREERYSESWCP